MQYATLMEELVKITFEPFTNKRKEGEIQGFSVRFEFEQYINILFGKIFVKVTFLLKKLLKN